MIIKKHSGFTLIELMIVVAIIGILGAIAYPSYIDSVRKGKRSDAHEALTLAMQKQEVFFANNARYGTLAELNLDGNSSEGYYTITGNCNAAPCIMVATPTSKNGQDGDSVSQYTLSSTGLKTATYKGSTKNSWTNF